MPKVKFIDPEKVRKSGEIVFKNIPVNQYNKTVSDELKCKNFTKEDLKHIYFGSWVESVEERIQHSENLIVKYANPHI